MDSPKTISAIIIVVGVIVAGFVLFSDFGDTKAGGGVPPRNNSYIQDGKQIIELHAKGGFEPKYTVAKAGVPTTLRITTSGTYDCSSIIAIPELTINRNLPANGVTDIDIGTRAEGILDGTCGMGMYPFTIDFK